ncbi:MAG: hypothetical protein EOP83_01125 [Verrucomicrobiaceae bacterium]|nr:MAG: hypothetical protein EOP83_01125 [Verrucomicrobiaceae bacterium]
MSNVVTERGEALADWVVAQQAAKVRLTIGRVQGQINTRWPGLDREAMESIYDACSAILAARQFDAAA